MQINPYTNEVIWPPRFKKLPSGYGVYQLDSGHYFWAHADGDEGLMSWDPYWVRRCAFAHAAAESSAVTDKGDENGS